MRRFAADAKIEFGEGATVLLAPNGTGKTAVFEAIELAITGKIARLKENLAPFIRDGETLSKVCLSFGDGTSRTVTLKRDNNIPALEGDIEKLLGDGFNQKDISYLLRLTHLLDQRDRNWFVQADSQDAGNQLTSLPIGRDALKASEVLVGARTEATKKYNEAKEKHDEAVEHLSKWEKLREVRNSSIADLGQALVPLENLLTDIRKSAKELGIESSIDSNLNAMLISIAEISLRLKQHIEALQTRKIAFAPADRIIQSFIEASNAWKQAHKFLEEAQADYKDISEKLANAEKDLKEKESISVTQADNLRSLSELLQRAINIRAKVATTETALKEASEALPLIEQSFNAIRQKYEEAQQSANRHQILRSRTNDLNKVDEEITADREILKRLEMFYQEFKTLDANTLVASELIKELTENHQKVNEALTNRQRETDEAQRIFDQLNFASGAIREAVGSIATHLPQDRGKCPVCLQVYSAQELQQRIAEALHSMDPALGAAAENVRLSKEAAETVRIAFTKTATALQDAKARLADLNKQKEEVQAAISEIRLQNIFSSGDTETVRSILDEKSIQLKKSRQALEVERGLAPVEPSPETLSEIESDLRSAESLLQSARARQDILIAEHERAKLHWQLVMTDMGEDTVESLTTKLADAEAERTKGISVSESARIERDRIRLIFDERDSDIRRATSLIETEHDRLTVLKAQWSEIPLEDEPSTNTLDIEKKKIEIALEQSIGIQAELDKIKIELAKWEAAQAYRHAQNNVDEMRGNASEENFTVLLEEQINIAKGEIQRLEISRDALESLSRFLNEELDNIQDRICSVEPLWKSLLLPSRPKTTHFLAGGRYG